jgi:hypothetical protein
MAEDRWISVADAADFLKTHDACRLIQRSWKLGTIRLYGVRPGESEPVEIPSNEGGRVGCKKSRIVIGSLFTTYQSVTMAWADVERLAQAQADAERLAQADAERLLQEGKTPASSPPKQAAQSPSNEANPRNLSLAEIGRTGGRKSGEVRRAGRKWVPHATELAEAACSREPAASHGRIAVLIADNWKLREVDCPGHDTLSKFVSELRASGQLPQRTK